jgi:hypothetical protein
MVWLVHDDESVLDEQLGGIGELCFVTRSAFL